MKDINKESITALQLNILYLNHLLKRELRELKNSKSLMRKHNLILKILATKEMSLGSFYTYMIVKYLAKLIKEID